MNVNQGGIERLKGVLARAREKVAGVADPEDVKQALYVGVKDHILPVILDRVPGGVIIKWLVEPVERCIRKAVAYYKQQHAGEDVALPCETDLLDELECVVRHFPNFWLIDEDPSHLYGVIEKNRHAEYSVEVCLPDGYPAARPQLVIPSPVVELLGEPELATLSGWNAASSRLVEVLVELRGKIAAATGLDAGQDAHHDGRLVYSHAGTIKEVVADSFYLSKAGFPAQRDRLVKRLDALVASGGTTGKILLLASKCTLEITADIADRRVAMRVEPSSGLDASQAGKLESLDFVQDSGDGMAPRWIHDVHQPAETFTVATMAFKVLVEVFGLKHHDRIDVELHA